MTKLRTRGITRGSHRQTVLKLLADAGGSMEYDDFRRVIGHFYTTDNGVAGCMSQLRRIGAVQRRVQLTASGSALLSKTLNADET
jgi:hypothetical protein